MGLSGDTLPVVTCPVAMLVKTSSPLYLLQAGLAFPIILVITSLTTGIIFTIRDISQLFRMLKCNYSVTEFALSYRDNH